MNRFKILSGESHRGVIEALVGAAAVAVTGALLFAALYLVIFAGQVL